MFVIFLSLVVASSASLIQYPNYNPDGYNALTNNYPSYSKPISNNYMNYPAASLLQPQSLCGFLNGVWKTFPNIEQFKEEIRHGFGWIFYGYGPCPGHKNSEPDQPFCAIYNNERRTFVNPFAIEIENMLTGANWVKLYSGACSNIPTPIKSTTVASMISTPSTPHWNKAVCGSLNEFRKTFSNINEFIKAKSQGWSFYGHGPCPRPEICAKFNNEFKTFPNIVALEVENYMTGKKWIIEFSGECPTTPPVTTSPARMTPNPSISANETLKYVADTSITTSSSPILPGSVEATPSSTTMPIISVDDSSASVAPVFSTAASISISTPMNNAFFYSPHNYKKKNNSSGTNRIQ